jgi:hypothetical protein
VGNVRVPWRIGCSLKHPEDITLPSDNREPQSYGSEKDWVTGHTGQQPNDPASGDSPATQREFYDERRESEENAVHQGGRVSPEQDADAARPAEDEGVRSPAPFTVKESGARRGGYFKERDYK